MLFFALLLSVATVHAQPPTVQEQLQAQEERIAALEAQAESLKPLGWLAGLALAGGIAAVASSFIWTKRSADRAITEAVGIKTRELHRLVEEKDLASYVRDRSRVVIVGPDGDRRLERLLLRDGWKNVSTATTLDGSPAAMESALQDASSAALVVFDRLPEDALIGFCERRGTADQRYAGFTRTPYTRLPNPVRDALVFGNTPDQLLHWVEAATLRQERARRRLDPGAPASA